MGGMGGMLVVAHEEVEGDHGMQTAAPNHHKPAVGSQLPLRPSKSLQMQGVGGMGLRLQRFHAEAKGCAALLIPA